MDKIVDMYELLDTDIPPAAAHHARMRTRIRNIERRPDRNWRMNETSGDEMMEWNEPLVFSLEADRPT